MCVVESAQEGQFDIEFLKEVFHFLERQGCINFGILRNDPVIPVPNSMLPQRNHASVAGTDDGAAPQPSDEAVATALYSVLKTVDLDTTSEKMLRKMLSEHFGVDMKPRKMLLKKLISEYLDNGGSPPKKKKKKKSAKIVIIGAGPSGLTAALHLKRHGCEVIVLEARDRVGGRVISYQAENFGAPIDLGASIITGTRSDPRKGLRADPSSILCDQMGISLYELRSDVLPLYDAEKRGIVDKDLDTMVERIRDEVMDRAAGYLEEMPAEKQQHVSFGTLLNQAIENWTEDTMKKIQEEEGNSVETTFSVKIEVVDNDVAEDVKGQTVKLVMSKSMIGSNEKSDDEFPASQFPLSLTEEHKRLLGWHWANLEYGCSAPLKSLSAEHWNQDEDYGGFGGPHCFVVGGYDQCFKNMANLLDVRLNMAVSQVVVKEDASKQSVFVQCEDGSYIACDSVIVTVPLGVLKNNSITFDPELPQWKQDSIQRLGFGRLDKVFLQFEEAFWDDDVDFFGAAQGNTEATRGLCFMYWNINRFSGVPILAALVSGEAAHLHQNVSAEELESVAVSTLRSILAEKNIPDPVSCHVTRWFSDDYAKGSYSFVAVGASGNDYDLLARPVGRQIFFAGEHTCRDHPDTVGGAMLTGLREAARILENIEEGAHDGHIRQSTATKRKMLADDEAVDNNENDAENKTRRALGRDIARLEEEMMSRQAIRESAKDMWRGLLAAQSGDTIVVCDCLNSAQNKSMQISMAQCLEEASKSALKNIIEDVNCLSIIIEWLSEAATAQMWSHLVSKLLKVLLVVPWDEMNKFVKKDSLLLQLKKLTGHVDHSIKLAAKQVIQILAGPEESDEEITPIQKKATVPDLEIEIDEKTKEEIAEAERELRALEEEAERIRAEAEAQLMDEDAEDEDLVQYSSFEEFRDAMRRDRKKPKTKMERKESTTPTELRRLVDGVISQALKPHYDGKKISKDSYKAIMKKAGDKIMSKVSERDRLNSKDFLRERRHGISKLVNEYVKTYAHRERRQ